MKILESIDAYSEELTDREQAIAHYIKDNYPNCLLDSATRLGHDVGVSTATVVRFFAKLGYASFRRVQEEVRADLSDKQPSPALRAALPHHTGRSVGEILDDVVVREKQNIDYTHSAVNLQELEAVVNKLVARSSGRVYITGAKNSNSLARHLATHLMMCMPNVDLLPNDAGLLADRMLWTKPSDLLLAFSIRRYSSSIVRTAKHFHQEGATVVGFTDRQAAPLVPYTHHNLRIFTQSGSPFDSYTAGMVLCNVLISAVAARNRTSVKESLDRGDKLWHKFDVFSPTR